MTMTFHPRPAIAPALSWSFPRANGMEPVDGLPVLFCHLPGRRIAAVEMVLDCGVERDPAGLDGLAALTARAVQEGTTTRDAAAFTAALEIQGASLSASASTAGMRLRLMVPVSRLGAALRLLAEAVISPAFDPGDVSRLVAERIEEISFELASPQGVVSTNFASAAFAPQSRVSRPGGGSATTVSQIDRAAVADFHRTHVLRAAGTLVVAADLADVDLTASIAAAFALWPGSRVARSVPVVPAAGVGGRVLVVDRPGAVQTQFAIGHAATDRHDQDWPGLLIAARVLGGSPTSRLDAVLREEKGYSYGVRAHFASFRRGGAFSVSGSVHTDATAPALADALSELRRLVGDGISAAERNAAVEYLAGTAPTQFETARAIAGEIADGVALDLPDGYVDAHLVALRRTSASAASNAAARHIRPDELVIIAAGDAEQIVDGLTGLGHGPVEVLDESASGS